MIQVIIQSREEPRKARGAQAVQAPGGVAPMMTTP